MYPDTPMTNEQLQGLLEALTRRVEHMDDDHSGQLRRLTGRVNELSRPPADAQGDSS